MQFFLKTKINFLYLCAYDYMHIDNENNYMHIYLHSQILTCYIDNKFTFYYAQGWFAIFKIFMVEFILNKVDIL